MRMKRLKMEEGTAVYHCMSRTVGGEHLLGVHEKETLRKMLWQVAGFCGVEVLAYCIMSNHFHVLVRVPVVSALPRDEILRRYTILYGASRSNFHPSVGVMEGVLAKEDDSLSKDWVERLLARMGNVSEFMKTLKQRFTMWFNSTHGRFGTIWAERFKSVLVEDCPDMLRVVAAYIDLNPVRAGLAQDPADYRWSSYAEAVGGNSKAQEGIASVVGALQWKKALPLYRMIVYGKGAAGHLGEEGMISWETAADALRDGGRIPVATLVRYRVRYFTEGIALGSSGFVQAVAAKLNRSILSPVHRRGPPVAIGADSNNMMALRHPRHRASSGVI